MTVGPLVSILKVPRSNKYELTMNERIHTRVRTAAAGHLPQSEMISNLLIFKIWKHLKFMDHVMAGIEDISGMMVGNYKLRDKWVNLFLLYFIRNFM